MNQILQFADDADGFAHFMTNKLNMKDSKEACEWGLANWIISSRETGVRFITHLQQIYSWAERKSERKHPVEPDYFLTQWIKDLC